MTDRKFRSAVAGFVMPTILAFGVTNSTATQVTAIIIESGTLIAYILGDGVVHAERSGINERD